MAELAHAFRLLNLEQKAAAVGAVLLAVSTFGPFSFVELAEILIAGGVLALLRARGLGREFHLPFGDGTVIAGAGIWAAALIVVRLFDRPLGQNLLALACAAILILAGARERAKRPADDLPAESRQPRAEGPPPAGERGAAAAAPEATRRAEASGGAPRPEAERPGARPATPAAQRAAEHEAETAGRERPDAERGSPHEAETDPLPPPEFEPYRPEEGEQLRLGREGGRPQPPGEG